MASTVTFAGMYNEWRLRIPRQASVSTGTTVNELSVLVIDGESTFARAVVLCLSAVPAVRVHVLSRSNRAPLRFSRRLASFHTWDGIHSPSASQECARIAQRVGADLCLAADDAAIKFLACEREHLPVGCAPVPLLASLDVVSDKWEFACFLDAHKFPQPATTLCSTGPAAEERIRALRFPALIKPRIGGNGIGIRQFNDPNTLLSYLFDYPDAWDRNILQTVIAGRDIDCSVLCEHGRVLAYTIQRGFTRADSFQPPGGIEFVDDPRVLSIVSNLMAVLEWNGIAHVDLRDEEGSSQVKVLEVNPRFWGSVLGSLHAGVNFPYLACLAGMDQPFLAPKFHSCRYVAGATAVRQWMRGQFGAKRVGFRFSDTVFRYVMTDPWPTLAELFLKATAHLTAAVQRIAIGPARRNTKEAGRRSSAREET